APWEAPGCWFGAATDRLLQRLRGASLFDQLTHSPASNARWPHRCPDQGVRSVLRTCTEPARVLDADTIWPIVDCDRTASLMNVSVLIPAFNEAEGVEATVLEVARFLGGAGIEHEI